MHKYLWIIDLLGWQAKLLSFCSKIKVKYKLINKNANLDLYIEGYDGLDQRYISIAFIFLDNLFGEFFVMNNINEIAFKPMLGSESELITLEVLKKQLVKELK